MRDSLKLRQFPVEIELEVDFLMGVARFFLRPFLDAPGQLSFVPEPEDFGPT